MDSLIRLQRPHHPIKPTPRFAFDKLGGQDFGWRLGHRQSALIFCLHSAGDALD